MATGQPRRGERGPVDDPLTGAVADALQRDMEELGLNPSEARVTLALLQLGSARSTELAKAAAVPRTNIYQVLQALADKGVVVRVPGAGPATWATPGRDKVLDRLETALAAAQEERLQQHRLRTARVRELLSETVADPPTATAPNVQLLTCPADVRRCHEQLLRDAEVEVVVFNRPPYSTVASTTNAAAMHAMARGVGMRILYQAAQVEDPEAHAFRAGLELYAEAGAESRVVDTLPIKLLVADRRCVLLAMDDPTALDTSFPVTLLIEHAGYAESQAEMFERYWERSRPYVHAPDAPARRA